MYRNSRFSHLIALLNQRPHGKATLSGGTLRLYQCRRAVLLAVECKDLPEGLLRLSIGEESFPLYSCQGYGCLLLLCDRFSVSELIGKTASLYLGEDLFASAPIVSWDN